jgi:hypothetical protein
MSILFSFSRPLSDDCMSEEESRAKALNPNTKLTTRSIGFHLSSLLDEAEGKLKVDIQLIPHSRLPQSYTTQ